MSVQTLTSATTGTPVAITGKTLGYILPGFMATVSGTLTYNIEATSYTANDGPTSSWVWTPLQNFTGLTASSDGTLTGMCTYIRPNVTAFTSGSLTFQVSQPTAK